MTTPSIRDQVTALIQIQDLDTKMDGLKGQLAALPALLKNLEDQAQSALKLVSLKEKALEEVKKSRLQGDAAYEMNQDRLTRSTKRLEEATNPQEYAATQKEIDQLKKMQAGLDEQKAKWTAESEGLEKEKSELLAKAEGIRSELASKQAELKQQSVSMDSDLAGLVDSRSKQAKSVNPVILSRYDRVRAGRKGIGFTAAPKGKCGACHMMLPPQIQNQALKLQDVLSCPSCQRLIYSPEALSGNANGTN